MYQKDFILRMVEMLGQLIAGILGLIRKGDFEKATETLESTYYEMLKQDASFFHKIPTNELTQTLLKDHNYTHGHLEMLAELMYTEAELTFAQDNKNASLICYEKSLLLFEFVMKETKVFSFEKENKIEYINKRIIELT